MIKFVRGIFFTERDKLLDKVVRAIEVIEFRYRVEREIQSVSGV